MKFGFRTTGFRNWDIKSALLKISEIGYSCVELCLEDPELNLKILDDRKIKKLKEYLTEAELEVAAISFHGGPIPVPIRVANTFGAIRIAAIFPPKLLIINTEKVLPSKRKEQYEVLVDRVNLLVKVAKDYGVTIAIEPEPDLIISNTKEALFLLEEIRSSHLTINLDIGHSYITGENLMESIKNLKNHLSCVHLDDMKGKKHEHLIPGDGEIDFRKVFNALQDIHYNGYLVVDLFHIQESPVSFADKSLKRLKEFQKILSG